MTTQEPTYKAGIYQGCRANPETISLGFSKNTNCPEMILQCFVPELGRELSVVLHWATEANGAICNEKLRATGWKGADISDLSGIGEKEFPLSVAYETYEGRTSMRTSILSEGGRIKSSKPTDLKTFAAAVSMIMGKKSSPQDQGGPPKIPFG